MALSIVLQGVAQSGKTTTLRKLANLFSKIDPNYDLLKGSLGKGDFVIKFKVNSKIICIISMGDNANLKDDMEILFKKYSNIDLFFGASRTKGETVKIHKNIAKKYNRNIIWSSTYKNKRKSDFLNDFKAKELYNLVVEMKII